MATKCIVLSKGEVNLEEFSNDLAFACGNLISPVVKEGAAGVERARRQGSLHQ